jgi:hypothetical protein
MGGGSHLGAEVKLLQRAQLADLVGQLKEQVLGQVQLHQLFLPRGARTRFYTNDFPCIYDNFYDDRAQGVGFRVLFPVRGSVFDLGAGRDFGDGLCFEKKRKICCAAAKYCRNVEAGLPPTSGLRAGLALLQQTQGWGRAGTAARVHPSGGRVLS